MAHKALDKTLQALTEQGLVKWEYDEQTRRMQFYPTELGKKALEADKHKKYSRFTKGFRPNIKR